MDMEQCNDAYGTIKVAVALSKTFNYDVNDFRCFWCEQKAVCILLTLLHLDIKNIHFGSTFSAFLSPNVLNYLLENFGIVPIATPEQNLANLLAQADSALFKKTVDFKRNRLSLFLTYFTYPI